MNGRRWNRMHPGVVGVVAMMMASAGCATDLDNAILELTFQLPVQSPRITTAQYALVQVARDLEFANPWPLDGPDGNRLEASPTTARYSVIADPEQVEGALRVKVLLCEDVRCGTPDDATPEEYRLEIERSHYLGARTLVAVPIETADISRIRVLPTITKCAVEGCAEPGLDTYCRPDGTHFCE
jgi:hypothetical protein